MRKIFLLIPIYLMVCSLFNSAESMSKLYDFELDLVLKEGVPCAYSKNLAKFPLDKEINIDLGVYGLRDGVFSWKSWLPDWSIALPADEETCIPYGFVSSVENTSPTPTLPHNVPLSFNMSLGISAARYNAEFCLRDRGNTDVYLSSVEAQKDGNRVCSDEPLSDAQTREKRLKKRFFFF